MRKSHPQPDNEKKRKNDSNYNARDKFQRAKKSEESTPKKLGAKFAEYARLNAPRSQILMDIKKDKDFKWPKASQVWSWKEESKPLLQVSQRSRT